MGRALIIAGIVLIVLGGVVLLGDRLPFRLGRLPGDIVMRGKNSTFYFPLTTCIVLSIVLSIVMRFLNRR